MRPTPVRLGIMDSRRPGLVAVLPATHLGLLRRLARATKRFVVASLASLVGLNVLLLFVPVPWVHLFTVPVALLLAPVLGVLTIRQRVLFGACEVACPRCARPVAIPQDFPGWPARINCLACGIRVELAEAPPNEPVAQPVLPKVA